MPVKKPDYKHIVAFSVQIHTLMTELPRVMSCEDLKPTKHMMWTIPGPRFKRPKLLGWVHDWKDDAGNVAMQLGACESQGEMLVRFPDFGDYYIDAGLEDIRGVPHGDTESNDLTLTMLGHIIPLCLAAVGRLVVHASAVKCQDGGAIFIGASGSGKSTLAAALSNAGQTFLADDGVALLQRPNYWEMPPGVTAVRLLPESARHLKLTGFEKTWELANGKTLYSPTPLYARKNPLPPLLKVKRIYFLDSTPGPISIQPLTAGQVVERLLKQLFRVHAGKDDDVQREFMKVCSLVDHTTCRLITHPRTWHSLPKLVELVKTDFGRA